MKKENIFHSIKCDIVGCNNFATSGFSLSGDKKSCLNLCSNCEKEIYKIIAEEIVPKSIPNRLKKPQKIESTKEKE